MLGAKYGTNAFRPMHLHSGTVELPANHVGLLVHGGAWDIPDNEVAAHQDGLHQALARGAVLLQDGASAQDVVAEVVAVMEGHGAFDAGCGAVLTRDGTVELDAGLMDGTTLAYAAVACVRRIAHPVHLAQRLLQRGEGQVRVMVGEGAEWFASDEGLPLIDNAALVCPRERQRYEQLRAAAHYHVSHAFLAAADRGPQGTVGCVARDRTGQLAAATSTGGTPFRPAGRVGDTPLPGCGFYADTHAAASATGWGEAIAAVLLCGRAVDAAGAGLAPEAVVRTRLAHLHARIHNRDGQGATAGLILLHADGRGAWAFTTPRMARGAWFEGGEAWVMV
jgi:beta-aspartyl-peptidase (threonine type)